MPLMFISNYAIVSDNLLQCSAGRIKHRRHFGLSKMPSTSKLQKNLFVSEFKEFREEGPNDLSRILDDFRGNIQSIHKDVVSMWEQLDTEENWNHFNECMDNLNIYKNYARSFYNFKNYLNQSLDTIDQEQLGDLMMKFLANTLPIRWAKAQILRKCFWFEKYFWWR